MSVVAEDRNPLSIASTCPDDGMPLFPTIVGPRCPICGVIGRG